MPDAPDGEIVDYVIASRIPVIVLTAHFSETLRESILSKNVIDYVLKDNPSSLDYVLDLVGRIHRNCSTKILVVDDSKTSRWQMAYLLRARFKRWAWGAACGLDEPADAA